LDDFAVPKIIGKPTTSALKQLQKPSIQSKCSAFFFKPTIIDGTLMLSSSLGPDSGLNTEDILMQKESSSEEAKSLQG
jgi:hypothetical protein